MQWEKINLNVWQNNKGKNYDFIITMGNKNYILDIFKSEVFDNNDSYIESLQFDNLKEAISEAETYI